jgi:hypothetical protein
MDDNQEIKEAEQQAVVIGGQRSPVVVLTMKVAELYAQGLSPLEIAIELDVPRYKVTRALKDAHELWRTKATEAIEKRKIREAMKLDFVEQEAYKAWMASKGVHKQVTDVIEMSATTRSRKNGIPAVAMYEGEAIPTFQPTRTVKSEKIYGDVACLRIMMDCIASRRKLFGLDAPQRTSLENPDGTNLLSKLEVVFTKPSEPIDLDKYDDEQPVG